MPVVTSPLPCVAGMLADVPPRLRLQTESRPSIGCDWVRLLALTAETPSRVLGPPPPAGGFFCC